MYEKVLIFTLPPLPPIQCCYSSVANERAKVAVLQMNVQKFQEIFSQPLKGVFTKCCEIIIFFVNNFFVSTSFGKDCR